MTHFRSADFMDCTEAIIMAEKSLFEAKEIGGVMISMMSVDLGAIVHSEMVK